jgi:hypothetical protein
MVVELDLHIKLVLLVILIQQHQKGELVEFLVVVEQVIRNPHGQAHQVEEEHTQEVMDLQIPVVVPAELEQLQVVQVL